MRIDINKELYKSYCLLKWAFIFFHLKSILLNNLDMVIVHSFTYFSQNKSIHAYTAKKLKEEMQGER
jgi:hypothetical protein